MGAIDELPLFQRHRITVDEYHRLVPAGVIAPKARVELIEGEVIEMAPIGIRHWALVNQLRRTIERAVGDRALVSESSMQLGGQSEPQPDIALFKPREDFYRGVGLPSAADTLLVVEVADSTVRYDREIKLPLYARHGVCELWIVDLSANMLRMHRDPQGERYLHGIETAEPGVVGINALPGVAIDLSGLFR